MSIIKSVLRIGFIGFLLLFTIYLLSTNFNLYSEKFRKAGEERDIILQLNFIGKELKSNNLGKRMQEIFPEGFVFTNVLYGLSWCELGISDSTKTIKAQALNEALYAYNQINTIHAKSIFSSSLIPENGIFYTGWNNYLLSKILLLDSNFNNSREFKIIYVKQCEAISNALVNSNSPFLQSYENQSWPADMCVAMASLSNHDKIFNPKYQTILSDWIINVKAKLDPKTKLVPHKVNSDNGKTVEGARGCSISLILRLMSEIDSNFAMEQYKLYKENFVSTTFGLPSINEYPKGQSGFGDIDSGPVIFGVGFAGTIVSLGTFSVLGDKDLSENEFKTINSFGLGTKNKETKKYILGLLPIADAFIAWGRSSGLSSTKSTIKPSKYWRLRYHMISITIITFTWSLLYFKKIRKKIFRKKIFRKKTEIATDKA